MKKWSVSFIFLCISLISKAQQTIDSSKNWSYHVQLTVINQGHPSFKAEYSGINSLENAAEKKAVSITSTLYVGRKLWKNAVIYGNAEIAGGSGISAAKGIAGFPNGETFRIGDAAPAAYLARLFFQQHIPLPNTTYEQIEREPNQIAALIPTSRITITAGKFSLSDFFDDNHYSHDPRTQFMNWSLMSNGAWDYPANTRGYTSGIIAELIKPGWSVRISSVVVPRKANGLQMDYKISKVHSETLEIEKNWKSPHPGAIRLLTFHTVSQAPAYATTISEVKMGDSSSVEVYTGVKEWKIYGGKKFGFGINAEQELTDGMGVFFKSSWNDGKTATWAFTEIDRSISAGINIKGGRWKRPFDEIGIAKVVNGLSVDHRNFLNAGLYGFIVGDGRLRYGAEKIREIYYQAQLAKTLYASLDYQFVNHPAYNKDRGPVNVFAIRAHVEF